MCKVHNIKRDIVCVIDDDGSIIIEAKGCKTILKPNKVVNYKITATKK